MEFVKAELVRVLEGAVGFVLDLNRVVHLRGVEGRGHSGGAKHHQRQARGWLGKHVGSLAGTRG